MRSAAFVMLLSGLATAAPSMSSGAGSSLEAAALQLGALQAQAQYPPAALQGARTASRSAASCLVTAVQYTHGQQIWRADPCEFCLCLDGEMFCWWQECPPAAPGPCPSSQPYSLCGNSSLSLENNPPPTTYNGKSKKSSSRKTTSTEKSSTWHANTTPFNSANIKPLVTTSNEGTASSSPQATNFTSDLKHKQNKMATKKYSQYKQLSKSKNAPKAEKAKQNSFVTLGIDNVNTTADNGADNELYDVELLKSDQIDTTQTMVTSSLENGGETKAAASDSDLKLSLLDGISDDKESRASTEATKENSRNGCLVMGTLYKVGEALPSTGSCLACHCTESSSSGSSSGPRVTCAPRGCAPPDPLATLNDDPGAF